VKPEAFLDAILDPQTGENVDLQMNFRGLRAAVDLRQVGRRSIASEAEHQLSKSVMRLHHHHHHHGSLNLAAASVFVVGET
jgi:hypothetical protein